MTKLPAPDKLIRCLYYYFDGEASDASEKGSFLHRWSRIHSLQSKILALTEQSFEPTILALEALVDKAVAEGKPAKEEGKGKRKKALGITLYEHVSETRNNVATDHRVGTIHG